MRKFAVNRSSSHVSYGCLAVLGGLCVLTAFLGCRDGGSGAAIPDDAIPDDANATESLRIRLHTEHSDAASHRSDTNPGDHADDLFVDISSCLQVGALYHSGRQEGQYAIIESLGGGVAAWDFDLDGHMDLVFAGGGDLNDRQCRGRACKLMRNLGNLQFASVTEQANCRADLFYNHGVFPGDFDGDGFPDLAISGYGGVQLLRNQGDGTFSELEPWVSHPHHPWSTSLAWADFDGDGLLDCYVTHYVNWSWENHPLCSGGSGVPREVCPPRQFDAVSDVIYFNLGQGDFQPRDQDVGLVPGGKGLGVVVGDINMNGHSDIYVCNDTTDNFLYWNDGNGRFTEAGVLAGVSGDPAGVNTGSMGVALADVNHDGLPDLWVTNFERELFSLYRNEGGGLFSHVSRSAGIGAIGGLYVGFGTVIIDPLADARPHIFVANGHVSYHAPLTPFRQTPLWLASEGNGRFVQVPAEGYFSQPHSGRGLIHVDLDNDGGWDLVFSHLEEPPGVLQGRQPPHDRWAMVQLVGRDSNREAIGASLRLQGPEGEHLYLVCGGGSYLSQSDRRLRIVAPGEPHLVQATVRWPSGQEETFDFPQPRSTTVWVEGAARPDR